MDRKKILENKFIEVNTHTTKTLIYVFYLMVVNYCFDKNPHNLQWTEEETEVREDKYFLMGRACK